MAGPGGRAGRRRDAPRPQVRTRPHRNPQPRSADPVTAYTLLVNPVCGGGSGAVAAESVARTLRDAGHDVTVTLTPGVRGTHDLVDQAVARGDVIVLVGGDGTLSSVAG